MFRMIPRQLAQVEASPQRTINNLEMKVARIIVTTIIITTVLFQIGQVETRSQMAKAFQVCQVETRSQMAKAFQVCQVETRSQMAIEVVDVAGETIDC
jgi:hypothetical protein